MKNIKAIPYVCSAGGKMRGAEKAAIDVKHSRLFSHHSLKDASISWHSDPDEIYDSPWGKRAHDALGVSGAKKAKDIVLWHCEQLMQSVVSVIEHGDLPLTIGGDHAMAIGSITGLARAKKSWGMTGVLWVDAHADFNTPQTSPSGNLHGMPLAALSGLGDDDVLNMIGKPSPLSPRHIAYVGLRDVDQGEKDFIAEYGIAAFYMDDIRREGLDVIMKKAQEIVCNSTKAVAVSVDLDAFDPKEAPSVGTPVSGGLHKEDMLPLLRRFVDDVNPDLIEISEYNPLLEGRDITAELLTSLMATLVPVREAEAA